MPRYSGPVFPSMCYVHNPWGSGGGNSGLAFPFRKARLLSVSCTVNQKTADTAYCSVRWSDADGSDGVLVTSNVVVGAGTANSEVHTNDGTVNSSYGGGSADGTLSGGTTIGAGQHPSWTLSQFFAGDEIEESNMQGAESSLNYYSRKLIYVGSTGGSGSCTYDAGCLFLVDHPLQHDSDKTQQAVEG